jgi:hypothetical protein
MKRMFYTLAVVCCPLLALCQDITGLWKGTMHNDTTQKTLPYEVVITKENGKYTGYTYSWFSISGKDYFGIKKVKVRIAKDGRIVIQDASLLENNYPEQPAKDVYQLNVLDFTENELKGPFVTNRTKQYSELTGNINLKKATPGTESELVNYLQKTNTDITARQ